MWMLRAQATQQKEMRTLNNRAVVRWHERNNRDLSKQRTNDRDRRLEALKANDFEAYQSMLRDSRAPDAQSERCSPLLVLYLCNLLV